MTKEEIEAKIEVLENIGGFSIEVDALKVSLSKAKSIKDMQTDIAVNFASWLWSHCTPPIDFFKPWKYGYPAKDYSTKELFVIFQKIPNYRKLPF